MNERIKELAEQCTSYNNSDGWMFDKQKFAELIVRECANFAYNYSYNEENVEHYRENGWDCLPGDLRSEMKEHFGVDYENESKTYQTKTPWLTRLV